MNGSVFDLVEGLTSTLSDWANDGAVWDALNDISDHVGTALDDKRQVCRMMATAALAVLEAAILSAENMREEIAEEMGTPRERGPLVKRLPPPGDEG